MKKSLGAPDWSAGAAAGGWAAAGWLACPAARWTKAADASANIPAATHIAARRVLILCLIQLVNISI
jgi:hypothetical protein